MLNVDPYYFAEGVYRLINSRMKEHIRTVLAVRGFSPADYTLFCYGGAGPMHLAGYSEGLPFKGVATLPWAAAFSSFGCAAVNISHRYQKSTGVLIEEGTSDDMKLMMGQMMLNAGLGRARRLGQSRFRGRGAALEGGHDPADRLRPLRFPDG